MSVDQVPEALHGDLCGRVAYVTGAGTGHGRAVAQLFAEAGAQVFAGHADETAGRACVEGIQQRGGVATFARLDVTSEASVLGWFEAGRAVGPPSVLVTAATLVGAVPLVETTAAFWDRMQAVNLRGVFLCMREALRAMVAAGSGGCIVNITTVGAHQPVRLGNAAYSSSKAGVAMLTRNAALEHAGDGIRVNAIAAGAIRTEDVRNPAEGSRTDLPNVTPERLLMGTGQPADVAAAALFLAGAGGRYITGQTLVVDGGYLLS